MLLTSFWLTTAKIHFWGFWLGATDRQNEGTWVWDKTETKVTYTDWQTGEPNNYGGDQNCLLIKRGYKYKWDDSECDSRLGYICQLKL